MPAVPLALVARTKKVGKVVANAAKPVTDSMCTGESLLSKRIECIERLGALLFTINGHLVTGGYLAEDEGEMEEVHEAFDALKLFYLQTRSFFSRKISRLLTNYMEMCRACCKQKAVHQEEMEIVLGELEFELRCSVSPLPLHLWLRITKYHLVPVVIAAVAAALYFLLTKEIPLGE